MLNIVYKWLGWETRTSLLSRLAKLQGENTELHAQLSAGAARRIRLTHELSALQKLQLNTFPNEH